MVQGGLFRAKRAASFGPNFRFDTAAADSSHCLSIFEEEHLGPTLLRGGAARIRDRRHHNALSTSACSSNQAVKVFLAKGAHHGVSVVSSRWSVVSGQLLVAVLPSAFCLPPSAFRLPPSAVCLLSSAFRLPPSAFRLPPSAFRLPPSDASRLLTPSRLRIHDHRSRIGLLQAASQHINLRVGICHRSFQTRSACLQNPYLYRQP